MTSFHDELRRRNKSDQIAIKDRLVLLEASRDAVDRQAYANLLSERHAPARFWQMLFNLLVEDPMNLAVIRKTIRKAAARYVLQGDKASIDSVEVQFGRVTTLNAFQALLCDQGRLSKATVGTELREILNKPLSYIKRAWRTTSLGKHLMWATFNEEDGNKPFVHDPVRRQIAGCLGLPKTARGHLVQLQYRLSARTHARFPSVMEAYAAPDWNYYFKPVGPDAAWGRTLPWDEPQVDSHNEVVHKVVLGASLTAKPRILR